MAAANPAVFLCFLIFYTMSNLEVTDYGPQNGGSPNIFILNAHGACDLQNPLGNSKLSDRWKEAFLQNVAVVGHGINADFVLESYLRIEQDRGINEYVESLAKRITQVFPDFWVKTAQIKHNRGALDGNRVGEAAVIQSIPHTDRELYQDLLNHNDKTQAEIQAIMQGLEPKSLLILPHSMNGSPERNNPLNHRKIPEYILGSISNNGPKRHDCVINSNSDGEIPGRKFYGDLDLSQKFVTELKKFGRQVVANRPYNFSVPDVSAEGLMVQHPRSLLFEILKPHLLENPKYAYSDVSAKRVDDYARATVRAIDQYFSEKI